MRESDAWAERIYRWRILILIALLAGIFSLTSADFFRLNTVREVLFLLPSDGMVALGLTLVMIVGELDVSVGATFALAGLVVYKLLPYGLGVALAGGLLVGALIGLINGFIVFRLKVNSLITTIAMSFILSGVALLAIDKTVQVESAALIAFGNTSIWLVPLSALLFIGLTVLLQWALRRTRFGLQLYAVGGSRLSSAYSGIPIKRVGVGVFMLAGLLAALGGVLQVARLGAASPLYGSETAIYVITAVLLGGTTLTGGYGDVVKSFLGVLLLSLFTKGFTLLQVPAFYQNMIIGAFLILLLYAGKRLAERRAARLG